MSEQVSECLFFVCICVCIALCLPYTLKHAAKTGDGICELDGCGKMYHQSKVYKT